MEPDGHGFHKNGPEEKAEALMKLLESPELLKKAILDLLRENSDLKEQVRRLREVGENGGGSEDGQDFCIDTLPSHAPEVDDGAASASSSSSQSRPVVQYDTDFEGLGVELHSGCQTPGSSSKNGGGEVKSKIGSSCFNCLGNHLLGECKEPKDMKRINKNRRDYMASQPITSSRYHVDEAQKFGHIEPGSLPSKRLRTALGMHEDKEGEIRLPAYIYRMRQLGYPPAWLKHARIPLSGLTLYLSKNRAITSDEVGGDDDGEVTEQGSKDEYDIAKLVAWPGFNVEPPRGCKEENYRYRAPPQDPKASLEEMKRQLAPQRRKSYQRGQMLNTDDDDDHHVQANGDGANENDDDDDPDSSRYSSTSTPQTSKTPQRGSSRVSTDDHQGTPICSLYSPFRSLPSTEKWTCMSTDHIFFENLPDSTGKYENIRGIIRKVRGAQKAQQEQQEGEEEAFQQEGGQQDQKDKDDELTSSG